MIRTSRFVCQNSEGSTIIRGRYLISSRKKWWMAFLRMTKEFKFPRRILRLVPAGRSLGSTTQTGPETGPIERDRSTAFNNKVTAGPGNPIHSLWRVTQQSHLRPLHFLCWFGSGPEAEGTTGICVSPCMCVCVSTCRGHKRRWPHMTWKQTWESCLNWS